MKKFIKAALGINGNGYARPLYLHLRSKLFSSSLEQLANIHGSDKKFGHNYIPLYERFFRPLRKQVKSILEIGIGGYDDPKSGGESLRIWKYYFMHAQVFGLDIYEKSFPKEARIHTFQGSQTDAEILSTIHGKAGDFDIIIDDGSHRSPHVIESFGLLFPMLKEGGLYVVEDTQTSYWPQYEGAGIESNESSTTSNFFKQLTDGLNHAEFLIPDYKPTITDLQITGIYFAHNIIVVEKGANNQPSNLVSNGKLLAH